MEKRVCPFCGKAVSTTLGRCPFCREAMPEAPVVSLPSGRRTAEGRAAMRRGLLWALLAGVIHYFAGGHSGLQLPVAVPGFVTQYLTPLLFLAGMGMVMYGLYLRYVRG